MSLATLLTVLSPFTPIFTLNEAEGLCFTSFEAQMAAAAMLLLRFLSLTNFHSVGAAMMPLLEAVTFCGTGFTKLICAVAVFAVKAASSKVVASVLFIYLWFRRLKG